MQYSTHIEIDANPDKVWNILTNASSYPEWEANVTGIDGEITEGAKITVHTKLSKRSFPVVVALDSEKQMTWTGGMPLGLFKGVRTFTLAPKAEGGTEFRMTEVFSGPLLPLIGRTIPDLQPSFEAFAAGLKRRAEA